MENEWDKLKKRKVNFMQRQEERQLLVFICVMIFYTALLYAIFAGHIEVDFPVWILYTFIICSILLLIPSLTNNLKYWRRYDSMWSMKIAIGEAWIIFLLFYYLIWIMGYHQHYGVLFLLEFITFFLFIPMFQPVLQSDQYSRMTIYSRVIASAERVTHEYLNGYHQHPVEVRIPGYVREQRVRFIRFLLDNRLIWKVKEGSGFVRLHFLPSRMVGHGFAMARKTSHITIHDDGRAEVFISKKDYDFLKEPISYDLLCQRVGEKMGKAYELIVEGKEKEVADVFTLKLRRKKVKRKYGKRPEGEED